MQSTTNYGLNIVEGTDIVNPLTQFNPNFTDIDTIMKANADASIDHATCIKTGTVHAVTRTNTNASVFRFTATGNWNTGDTMTVDGTLVSVFTPAGTSPLEGCFVINTEVIAAIQGTRVTLFVASLNADQVYYDNNDTVKDKIDDCASKEQFGIVTGSVASTPGWTSYFDLPSGFTASNCVIMGIQYEYSAGVWRSGDGASGNEYRFMVEMSGTSYRVFQNDPTAFNAAFKITFYKYA